MNILMLILLGKQTLLFVFYLIAFYGLGRLFLKKIFKLKFKQIYEEIFYSLCLGLGIAILYITVLSLFHVLYSIMLIPLLVGLFGLKNIEVGKNGKYFIIISIMVFTPIIFMTLYPAIKWDDISYHLPISQSIIDNKGLTFNEYLRYPTFPINGEILFITGLIINQITAQLITVVVLFTLSIGIFSFTYESQLRTKKSIIVFLLLISNTLVISLSTINYIDIILTLFITASILSLTNYLHHDQNIQKWLFLSAFFLGIAVGIKYTGLVFCLILGIFLLLQKKKLPFLKYTFIVLIVSITWFLRNYYFTGNPIWPFMSNIFGYGNVWNSVDYEGQFNDFKTSGIEKKIFNFIRIPMYLNNSVEGNISYLLWLGLIIYILFVPKKRIEFRLLIVAFLFTCFWFLSLNLSRYYLPIIPLICILSAIGYCYLINQITDKKIRNFIVILIIFFTLFNFSKSVYAKIYSLGYPPHNKSEQTLFLEGILPTYEGTIFASNLDGLTYGLLNENMYYYGKEKIVGDWFGKARYSEVINRLDKPKDLYNYLVNLNIKHLLINKTRVKEDLSGLNNLEFFEKIYEDKYTIVYNLS